eukprot:1145624-Pelagomonas_calceolata.AAC.1
MQKCTKKQEVPCHSGSCPPCIVYYVCSKADLCLQLLQVEAYELKGAPPAAQPTPSPKPTPMHPVWDLVAGSMSGATAVMITYPLDLVRTR